MVHSPERAGEMEQGETLRRAKADFFNALVWKYEDAMRFLFRVGKLTSNASPRDDWRNVAEHCLTEVAVAEELAELLGLETPDAHRLSTALALHDWDKMRELRKRPLLQESLDLQQFAAKLWQRINPDVSLINVTRENGKSPIHAAAASDILTTEELAFYIDNICEGSFILSPSIRLDRVAKRRPDLAKDFFDAEKKLSRRVEEKIFLALKARGVLIERQQDIPLFLKDAIQQRIRERAGITAKGHIRLLSEERRGNPDLNEDGLSHRENEEFEAAAVIDGGTGFKEVPYFQNIGKSPARLLVEHIITFAEALPIGMDPTEALTKVNQQIRAMAATLPVNPEDLEELFTSVALFARRDKKTNTLRYASVGDCTLIVVHPDHTCNWHTRNDMELFDAKELEMAKAVSDREGISMKETLRHPDVAAVIATSRKLENAPDGSGYGALKGSADEAMNMYMQSGEVQLAPGDRAFLITDGLIPSPLFNENEENRTIVEKALAEGGLPELLRVVRHRQIADKDCKRFLRFKRFDDATGIELGVTQR